MSTHRARICIYINYLWIEIATVSDSFIIQKRYNLHPQDQSLPYNNPSSPSSRLYSDFPFWSDGYHTSVWRLSDLINSSELIDVFYLSFLLQKLSKHSPLPNWILVLILWNLFEGACWFLPVSYFLRPWVQPFSFMMGADVKLY